MSPTPARYLTRLWRQAPQDLSVSWIAVSILYFLNIDGLVLPEPELALVVSTSIGLASAIIKSGSILGSRPDDPRSSHTPAGPHQHLSLRGPLPSDPFTPAPEWSTATGSVQVQARPVGTGTPSAQRSPDIRPGGVQTTSPPVVLPVRSQLSAQVPKEPPKLDYAGYAAADESEIQCPHCGSFAVTVNDVAGTAQDATCGLEPWPIIDSAQPDVVVRSWLSP